MEEGWWRDGGWESDEDLERLERRIELCWRRLSEVERKGRKVCRRRTVGCRLPVEVEGRWLEEERKGSRESWRKGRRNFLELEGVSIRSKGSSFWEL